MRHMRRSSAGFTLIEALVALLVLAIGMLAVAGLQVFSLQSSQSSFQRSVAVVQANDLVERLWADICSLPDSSDAVRDDWRTEYQGAQLPGWEGDLSLEEQSDGSLRYEINVRWDGRMGTTDEFTYTAIVPLLDNCPDDAT